LLIKAGVDISRLKREIRRALNIMTRVVAVISEEELVVTSTYEGNHSPGSLHYCNEAVDIRKPAKSEEVAKEIRRKLGYHFVVILERNHIHVGYDPK